MRACLRRQLLVLGCAWWLLLLLPALALLPGWEAAAVIRGYLRGAVPDPRSALALALDVRHLLPLSGAVWAALYLGMDYSADAPSLALSRGYSRGQVLWSKYLLFLAGCGAMSVMEQTAVLTAVPGLTGLPPGFLLRCFFLRLALDLGMMAPPALCCFLARENLYVRLLGLLYGVALWRLMKSHCFLWLQYTEWRTANLWALWPLAALGLGTLCIWAICHRKMDGV